MLIGQYNKFGNVDPGFAVVVKTSGKTYLKYQMRTTDNAIPLDGIKEGDRPTFVTIKSQADVTVLSGKMTRLVKQEILNTPGYRGLLI